MQFDYYKENPYKAKEASFNSYKYNGVEKSLKNQLFKWFEKLDVL